MTSATLRRLLPPLAAVLVPMFLLRQAWHLLVDAETSVVDGVLVFGGDGWFVTAVGAVTWTAAVLTGVAVLDGGARPFARAIRALPVALAGLVAFLVPLTGCLWLAGL